MSAPDTDALARIMEIIAGTLDAVPHERLREAERRVRAEFGADEIYIARHPRADRADRADRIRRELAEGRPPKEVANRYGVSRQWVRRVRGRQS